MPSRAKNPVPGGTCFFTVHLARRGATTLTDEIELLRAAFRGTQRDMPFTCNAMVVLPDHLHAIWTLPEGDADYSRRWGMFKARFSRALRDAGRWTPPTGQTLRKGEAGLWQRRFWDQPIRDTADLRRHTAYCWSDPVRHGLVQRASDWPYSSLRHDIKRGTVPPDWSARLPEGRYGEAEDASPLLPRGPARGYLPAGPTGQSASHFG